MADLERQPWVEELDRRSATAGRAPLVTTALEYAEAHPEPSSLTPFVVFVATGLGAAVAWYCGEIFGGNERRLWRAATIFLGLASMVLPILLQLRRSRP